MRVADLFSGVGGLSVAACEAARSAGVHAHFALAADIDQTLLGCYTDNLEPGVAKGEPIEEFLDGELGSSPTGREQAFRGLVGPVDIMLAGPPCQGHSDLNNHTRRNDVRNALYLRAARFAEIFRPRHLLIENVRGAVHDKHKVVQLTIAHLADLGYSVDAGVVKAEAVGVPQTRRRYFILASRTIAPSLRRALELGARSIRPVSWAFDDLGENPDSIFDSPATHSLENQRRIAYLFDQGLFELPDAERPACHRDKPHSYRSVYGRMRPSEPAPTITGGFGSTGQGRFAHPWRGRTLTPHEAARVQTFPDWFKFAGLKRRGAAEGDSATRFRPSWQPRYYASYSHEGHRRQAWRASGRGTVCWHRGHRARAEVRRYGDIPALRDRSRCTKGAGRQASRSRRV